MNPPVKGAIMIHDLHRAFWRHGPATRRMAARQAAARVIKGLR